MLLSQRKLTCWFSGCPGCGWCPGGPAQPRSPTGAGQWSWWSPPEGTKWVIIFIILFHHTWDFSTLALSLSHIADTSRPSAFSWNQGKCVSTVYCGCWLLTLSPCAQNSSMSLSTHSLYSSSGLVGLERSEQWTMFCRTWENWSQFELVRSGTSKLKSAYLDPVVKVVEHEDSVARDFLGFQHCLEVGKQLHVLTHVSGQHLWASTNQRGASHKTDQS